MDQILIFGPCPKTQFSLIFIAAAFTFNHFTCPSLSSSYWFVFVFVLSLSIFKVATGDWWQSLHNAHTPHKSSKGRGTIHIFLRETYISNFFSFFFNDFINFSCEIETKIIKKLLSIYLFFKFELKIKELIY